MNNYYINIFDKLINKSLKFRAPLLFTNTQNIPILIKRLNKCKKYY